MFKVILQNMVSIVSCRYYFPSKWSWLFKKKGICGPSSFLLKIPIFPFWYIYFVSSWFSLLAKLVIHTGWPNWFTKYIL